MQVDRLLCETEQEEFFVECLMVLVIVQVQYAKRPWVETTDDYLIKLAARRHPGTDWGPQQVERLKAKYIDRPGKPAERFGLMEQWARGSRGRDGKPGKPSAYMPSGILQMLDDVPDRETTADALSTV